MSYYNELTDIIKDKRPSLKDSSVDLYVRNMRKLSELSDVEFENVDFLNNPKKIDELLINKSLHTRKTYYASIVVVLMAIDGDEDIIETYRSEMDALQEFYAKEKNNNTKSKKMVDNWLEYTDMLDIMNKLRKTVAQEGIFTKTEPSKKDMALAQQLVITSLYLLEPEENPPVRLNYIMEIIKDKDYKEIVEPSKNYLVVKSRNNKYFAFNDYKTSGTYKEKEIKLGKKLNTLLNKWLKINKSGYLLLNNKDEPLTSNGLTKALNKIFKSTGKNISASMIRHSYLSHRFGASVEDKKIIADAMLHSVSEQNSYIKTN